MLPPTLHQHLPWKTLNPCTKEDIVESGDSCDEDDPLDDGGDPQADKNEVDSKQSSDDDMEEPPVSDEGLFHLLSSV